MGRRAGRKRPTKRQKIALADTRRVTNPNPCPRMVACGVRKAGQAPVTYVDFTAFSRGGVPDLEHMNDLGRGVVVAIADKLGCTPSEIIERVRG